MDKLIKILYFSNEPESYRVSDSSFNGRGTWCYINPNDIIFVSELISKKDNTGKWCKMFRIKMRDGMNFWIKTLNDNKYRFIDKCLDEPVQSEKPAIHKLNNKVRIHHA